MEEDGFVLVPSKKNKRIYKTSKQKKCVNKDIAEGRKDKEEHELVDIKDFCKKIEKSEIDVVNSEFFQRFVNDTLAQHELVVPNSNFKTKENKVSSTNIISKIICLGLGNFTSSKEGEYQLVFLKCLVKILGLEDSLTRKSVLVFDPVHTKCEESIIQELGFECAAKANNLEGKYSLKDEDYSGTLFYLPHCPKQLTNNILWANWQPELLGSASPECPDDRSQHGIYILGNSFESITSSLPDRILKERLEYILLSSSYVFETKVDNCFKYSDIFNDTSLHSFPIKTLPSSSDPIWKLAIDKGPPIYKEDVEFIQDKI